MYILRSYFYIICACWCILGLNVFETKRNNLVLFLMQRGYSGIRHDLQSIGVNARSTWRPRDNFWLRLTGSGTGSATMMIFGCNNSSVLLLVGSVVIVIILCDYCILWVGWLSWISNGLCTKQFFSVCHGILIRHFSLQELVGLNQWTKRVIVHWLNLLKRWTINIDIEQGVRGF